MWILHLAKFRWGTRALKNVYSVPAQETDKHRAMFDWLSLSDVAAVMKPRRNTCCNMLGCPKLANGSQPLVGRSSPCCEDMWKRYCYLTSFFPIVDTCLSCKDMAGRSCAKVRRWRFYCDFLRPVFSASCVQYILYLHSKFALRPHHVLKYGRHPISDCWE